MKKCGNCDFNVRVELMQLEKIYCTREMDALPRQPMPLLDTAERGRTSEVETGLKQDAAVEEAKRCGDSARKAMTQVDSVERALRKPNGGGSSVTRMMAQGCSTSVGSVNEAEISWRRWVIAGALFKGPLCADPDRSVALIVATFCGAPVTNRG